MKGLMLKDFIVIAKQLKLFLLLIPLVALLGGISMSVLAVLLGAALPMTAMAYDERSKWLELAAMMPYTKKELVLNKYLLGYVCMFGTAVLVCVGQLCMKVFGSGDMAGSMQILGIAIFGGLFFIAINMPILFKFGSEKGRLIFIFAMMLVGMGGSLLGSGAGEISDLPWKVSGISPLFILALVLILNYISIMVSIRIKDKG